jgi:prepilin-type N-terminal cleavage/methylation domain-containing protein
MAVSRVRRAFTLVEILVVIGIIAVLIGILMPTIGRARAQANAAKCAAQMRDIGQQLMIYATANKGIVIPLKALPPADTGRVKHRGGDENPDQRWPMFVFNPPPSQRDNYIAPQMFCPTDSKPEGDHSYNLNGAFFPIDDGRRHFLGHRAIRVGDRIRNYTASEAVLMVDKWPANPEWHLDVYYTDLPAAKSFDANRCAEQWDRLVFDRANAAEKKKYKHGKSGNNYLHFDFSVSNNEPRDPRDPPGIPGMAAPHTYLQG